MLENVQFTVQTYTHHALCLI